MKECDCCKSWFNHHYENFERISNNKINLSQFYSSCCDRTLFAHLNLPPYLVYDKLFMELCIPDEKMHLTSALAHKKSKSFINENLLREFIYSGLIKNVTLIAGH